MLTNNLAEIGRLGQELEAFAETCDLPPRDLFQLNIILEEIVANIISYGYDDGQRHEIAVHADLRDNELTVEVEDDGRAFNPLQVPQPDFNRPLEEMRIGGLGIHLVREMTADLQYERKEGKNRLFIRKFVGS